MAAPMASRLYANFRRYLLQIPRSNILYLSPKCAPSRNNIFSHAGCTYVLLKRDLHLHDSRRSKEEPPNSSDSDSSDASSSDDESTSIDLRAKPRDRRQERKKMNKLYKPRNATLEVSFAEKLLNAAEAVGNLSNEPNKTVSDLLHQLQSSAVQAESKNSKESNEQTSLGDLLSSMKLETEQSKTASYLEKNQLGVPTDTDGKSFSSIALFTGTRMNIFNSKSINNLPKTSHTPLFDAYRKKELERLSNFPPKNAFQEMIQWTKQGRMWNFPIDNEQGLEHEQAVPFTQHVFLEHLIDDFPKKGPIRHFMELIVVGLSKNPYVTVKEKHDQIQWFRDYFKDKMHLVEFADSDKTITEPERMT